MRLPRLLGRLPERFRWTIHNLVAHPLSELLFQVGLRQLSDTVHDLTVPEPPTPTRPANGAQEIS